MMIEAMDMDTTEVTTEWTEIMFEETVEEKRKVVKHISQTETTKTSYTWMGELQNFDWKWKKPPSL